MLFKDFKNKVKVKTSNNYESKANNFVFKLQKDEKITSITLLFGNFCCARAF